MNPRYAAGLEYDDQGIVTADAYSCWAEGVVTAGAGLIGGCCGIGPEHIKRVAQLLNAC